MSGFLDGKRTLLHDGLPLDDDGRLLEHGVHVRIAVPVGPGYGRATTTTSYSGQ